MHSMRILIADDDDVSRHALQALLAKQGHEVVSACHGDEAWNALQVDEPPMLAIFDWMMPGLDGAQLCRRIRADNRLQNMYLMLLSIRGSKKHLLEGLRAGANDYIAKPFDYEELEARLFMSTQVVQLQFELARRVTELEDALARVKQLHGLLPMCSYCKSIRDDQDYWHRVEKYIGAHSGAQFSHGICPECWTKVVVPAMQELGVVVPEKPC
jgi:phosphoserine phosphatase RsbU/P